MKKTNFNFLLTVLLFLAPHVSSADEFYDISGNKIGFELFVSENIFSKSNLEIVLERVKMNQEPGLTVKDDQPNEKYIRSLANMVKHSDYQIAASGALLLGAYKPQELEVQLSLVAALKHPDVSVQEAVAWALINSNPQDNRVFLKLLDLMVTYRESEIEIDVYASQVLYTLVSPNNYIVLEKLVQVYRDSMTDYDKHGSHVEGYALLMIKPQNDKILLSLIEIFEKDPRFKTTLNIVIAANPRSKKVHMALANLLKSDNRDIFYKVRNTLDIIAPEDAEVLQLLQNCKYVNNKSTCNSN